MDPDQAIVNPVRTSRTPDLPPLAIMVSTRKDLETLCRRLCLDFDRHRQLFISRLYLARHRAIPFALVGPLVGSPYAVMVLETLITWGARKIIFLGWCGAVSKRINIGNVILPTAAIIDEGTSRHYIDDSLCVSYPSDSLTENIRTKMKEEKVEFQEGTVWTTDGIFRETAAKVTAHQNNNVLGVEMELSALFSVGKYRNVDVGGLLVVSDDLSSLQWQPGFKDERFKDGRELANGILIDLITEIDTTDG